MKRRLIAILHKEFIHIYRDWRSLLIIILMPVAMIILYGYGITMEMRGIRFAVIDEAQSPESREIIRAFNDNDFFKASDVTIDYNDIEQCFLHRTAALIIIIPPEFSTDLQNKRRGRLQLIIDASDSNAGTFISTYSEQVLAAASARINGSPRLLFDLTPRILYNPDMKSSFFFVPGLVSLILMLISSLLTSITITQEKETGTLEQILVSPVRPFEIIVGKVAPYLVIGLVNTALIILSARILFAVPVHGDLSLLALLSLVYVFVALSFGLLFSTVAKTQQVAMFMVLLATILPTMMLSGFIFPLASMPAALQWVSLMIPATYYLKIILGIMLKGAGIQELITEIAILCAFGIVLITVATYRFRIRLD